MQTFLTLTDLPSFDFDLNNFLEWANVDYENYLKALPLTETVKYKNIKDNDLIKIYAVLINQNRGIKLGKESPDELYNICVDVYDFLEQNPNIYNSEIDTNYYSYKYLSPFNNIKTIIPNTTLSSWIFVFKDNSTVTNYQLSESVVFGYFLIEDGYFSVNVNGEEKILTKKGDYAIFDGSKIHSLTTKETEAKLFVTTLDPLNLSFKSLS